MHVQNVSKRFRQAAHLKGHMLIHTGETTSCMSRMRQEVYTSWSSQGSHVNSYRR